MKPNSSPSGLEENKKIPTSVLQENALTRIVTILVETILSSAAAESLPAKQVLLGCKARLRDNSSVAW